MTLTPVVLAQLDPSDHFQVLVGLIFITTLEGFLGVGAILFALTRDGLETWVQRVLVVFGLLLVAHAALMWFL
ncbi:MAG TPA: hypothetical protein VMZ92_07225 [Planctomycetota bacterium]|nr:hypothetical protein [Planctomycetota bacterium]